MFATLDQASMLRLIAPTTSLSRLMFELSWISEVEIAMRITPAFQRRLVTVSSAPKDVELGNTEETAANNSNANTGFLSPAIKVFLLIGCKTLYILTPDAFEIREGDDRKKQDERDRCQNVQYRNL